MGFFGGAISSVSPKSVIRTEWDQGAGQDFFDDVQTDCLWATTETFNIGDLFIYHADYNSNGYTAIEVTRDSKIIVNCSLGSEGSQWSGASLVTNLLNANGSVIDVFYELPVPASGSLYPTASSLIRSVLAGDILYVSFKLAGADFTSSNINALSAWAIAEL